MTDRSEYPSDGIAAFEAKHFPMAAQILAPLAESGDAEAQVRMAVMQQNGLGMVTNLKEAVKNMRNAASKGHGLAIHGLGFMYYEGEGVEQNYPEAVKLFEKAAAQGLVGSMMTLSNMYADGIGVGKDSEKAQYWFNKSMEIGDE
jgi:TPR repeat protein